VQNIGEPWRFPYLSCYGCQVLIVMDTPRKPTLTCLQRRNVCIPGSCKSFLKLITCAVGGVAQITRLQSWRNFKARSIPLRPPLQKCRQLSRATTSSLPWFCFNRFVRCYSRSQCAAEAAEHTQRIDISRSGASININLFQARLALTHVSDREACSTEIRVSSFSPAAGLTASGHGSAARPPKVPHVVT